MEQNKSVNKFNLIFRTTYFSKTNRTRKIYNTSLFSTVILLFLFLILSLVITFSLNLNINYFIKDIGTDKLTKIFGDNFDNYTKWSNSNALSADFGSFTKVTGGAITLGSLLKIDGIVSATTVLSFISVAIVLTTIIFKKQTLASYVSFGISGILLIILIVLFSLLMTKGTENDVIKNFISKGEELKKAVDWYFNDRYPDPNLFETKLTEISDFLQGIK